MSPTVSALGFVVTLVCAVLLSVYTVTMRPTYYLRILGTLYAVLSVQAQKKIVLTNDDGWDVANIRQQFDALTNAGFNVSLFL